MRFLGFGQNKESPAAAGPARLASADREDQSREAAGGMFSAARVKSTLKKYLSLAGRETVPPSPQMLEVFKPTLRACCTASSAVDWEV
jgi:hypothetical protein